MNTAFTRFGSSFEINYVRCHFASPLGVASRFPLTFHFLKRKVPCPRSHPISSCAIITDILFFPLCRCHNRFYFPFRVNAEDPVVALHKKPLWSWETDTGARQTMPMPPFPLFLPAARSSSGGACSSNHSAPGFNYAIREEPTLKPEVVSVMNFKAGV